ncbi:MAG: zinc ribbon domain-containing protein [Candidatus Methanomethylophilaceae archaeon]
MNRFCSACGFALVENARFCIRCGTPVSADRFAYTGPAGEDAGSVITAESLFNITKQELSDLFSYNRLGREFTGDISIIRDRVRRTVRGTPSETLDGIAESHMAGVRQRLSQIDDGVNDRNWDNVADFLKNGLPAAIVSYFYNPLLASEVKSIMDLLKELSKKGWDKTSFLGKAAVPSAKFEDVYTLRYITSNIRF